jgi:hypothetical protein
MSRRSFSTLTSKRFLLVVASLVFGVALPLVVANLVLDEFGLFWPHETRRIWTLEKTSKYLLSFRYIPSHFDGLLIGPSFSDGLMDTRALPGRIYNASMDAADASELRPVAMNAIDRGRMKVLILCISPYLTKDHGMKGPQIDAKEYWGSVFSWLPFEVEAARIEIRTGRIADSFRGSEWGMGNLIPRKVYSWRQFEQVESADAPETRVDPQAYAELGAILQAARNRGVKIYAYFYPYSYWSLESVVDSGEWRRYQARMRALFEQRDVVWDMTEPQYDYIRRDAACYTDGHLSEAGARLVLSDISWHLTHDASVHAPPSDRVLLAPRRHACRGQAGAGSGFDLGSDRQG